MVPSGDQSYASGYLDIYLGPLAETLARPDVTDIYVNRPGEIWIETLGGSTESQVVPGLTDALLWRLARQVASLSHQGISREHPLLAATLSDGSRIQIVAPPATRAVMAIAIRKHVSSDLSLDDCAARGMFDATKGSEEPAAPDEHLSCLYRVGNWNAFLKAAVDARKTIIVSGGTSTGKTTFLNALTREISHDQRLVFIEDTPELHLHHTNAVSLIARRGQLGEANVTADDLLIASLRMRPDRIVLGELRGAEAFTFLRAINTGHPGSMTTIHADTAQLAIKQLVLLVLQAGLTINSSDVHDYIGSTVDVIVQLNRHLGHRRVASVYWKDAANGADNAPHLSIDGIID